MSGAAMRQACLVGCLAWQPGVLRRTTPTRLAAPVVAVESTTAAWTDLTDDAQRLTDAQMARTVGAVCVEGVLASRLRTPGEESSGSFPSYAPFFVDDSGCPIMPLDSAEVAGNLEADSMATFYARAPRGGASAQSVLTLVGKVEEYSVDEVTNDMLARVCETAGVSAEEIAKRSWRRLVPERVHLKDAVRGVEAWVPVAEYTTAEANPLAPAVTSLLSKINGLHKPALRRFAAVFTGVPIDDMSEAELLSVDQLGFDMRAQLGPSAPVSTTRIGFRLPPGNEEEGISVFMKLFQEAYERQNGFM